MSMSVRFVVLVAVAPLVMRCDCGGESKLPPHVQKERAGSAVHAGVGDACYSDYLGSARGCSWDEVSPTSSTCAGNLACCTNPGYLDNASLARYVCAPSDRCETSKPGAYCSGTRDCQHGYSCVSGYCATSVGAECATDTECVTLHCAGGRCAYRRPEARVPDGRPDVARDLTVDILPDAGSAEDSLAKDANSLDLAPTVH
jgi:hypothetical protein